MGWKLLKSREIKREDGKLYMKRWHILSTPWFGIKLHKIVASDYDCLHDHPWSFISLILKGGYVETRRVITDDKGFSWRASSEDEFEDVTRIYHPGNILWRPAKTIHRLEIHQPCWTLVLNLKRSREWGFWTPFGWVHWEKYIPTNGCEA